MEYYVTHFTILADASLMQSCRELLADTVAEAGYEAFEDTTDGVDAYIQTQLLNPELTKQLIDDFPIAEATITFTSEEVEQENWNAEYEKEVFDPIRVGDTCIIYDATSPEADQLAASAPISIAIDQHMAFGNGAHETTKMIVTELVTSDLKDKRVLDCGCGTGILSIAALKSGTKHVVGYDIDEWSADNARHNAVINRVDSQFVSMLGDSGIIQPMLNDGTPLFDIITANINRNILIGDMPNTTRALKPGGMMILSGFLIEDKSYLTDAASHYGLWLKEEKTDNGWMMLVFQSSMP